MQVYRGREFDPVPPGQLQGTNVVVELLQGSSLLHKGYHVFCDSFFTSLNLGHRLLQLNTYLTGTLRKNRPMPHLVKDANQPGNTVYLRRGDFLCLSHFGADEKKPVRLLSTILPAQELGSGKPRVIASYNTNMGAVNMNDGILHSYGKQRKCQKVWKKILVHLLFRILMNSYILYKENTALRAKSRLQYIQAVIEALAGTKKPDNPRRRAVKKVSLITLPQKKEKDCCVCSSRMRHGRGIRRRSRTICSLCERGLHRQCIGRHLNCIEQ
ncbi:piggyBac transposable element-derived protein 4-like [Pecten maximus]|uniref:piggyBac transposable element-derived protein 4-like n=1 Tax=Pecten maximus TaxID=6579 RepID=UPI00145823CC|nr:piggyBac transposable element-derived protein 4-like [Pecten maximus]